MMNNGISLIICCYNSSKVILQTLQHVANQNFKESINYEIIIVDNASTDTTVSIVRTFFDSNVISPPYRIVYEAKPGLINARRTGVLYAKYDFVIFCDDDNRLCSNYVEEAFFSLRNNPKIGACGGKGIPVFEGGNKPEWFQGVLMDGFAVGSQSDISYGKVSDKRNYLYGAGIAFRKEILDIIFSEDIHLLLTGRNGNKILAGDDSEISFFILDSRLELWYNELMLFEHYLVKSRLSIEYVFKMYSGFGRSLPYLQIYYSFLENQSKIKSIIGQNYITLMWYFIYLIIKCFFLSIKNKEYRVYTHMFVYALKEHISLYSTFSDVKKRIYLNIKAFRQRLSDLKK